MKNSIEIKVDKISKICIRSSKLALLGIEEWEEIDETLAADIIRTGYKIDITDALNEKLVLSEFITYCILYNKVKYNRKHDTQSYLSIGKTVNGNMTIWTNTNIDRNTLKNIVVYYNILQYINTNSIYCIYLDMKKSSVYLECHNNIDIGISSGYEIRDTPISFNDVVDTLIRKMQNGEIILHLETDLDSNKNYKYGYTYVKCDISQVNNVIKVMMEYKERLNKTYG